jgi:hypothetical protein
MGETHEKRPKVTRRAECHISGKCGRSYARVTGQSGVRRGVLAMALQDAPQVTRLVWILYKKQPGVMLPRIWTRP